MTGKLYRPVQAVVSRAHVHPGFSYRETRPVQRFGQYIAVKDAEAEIESERYILVSRFVHKRLIGSRSEAELIVVILYP